jgi:hypothetical protein
LKGCLQIGLRKQKKNLEKLEIWNSDPIPFSKTKKQMKNKILDRLKFQDIKKALKISALV